MKSFVKYLSNLLLFVVVFSHIIVWPGVVQKYILYIELTLLIFNLMFFYINLSSFFYKKIFFVLTLLIIIFSFLEVINYQNFVFSKLHVDIQGLVAMMMLLYFYYLYSLVVKKNFVSRLILILLFALSYTQWPLIYSSSLINLSYVVKNRSATYDEKMKFYWGDEFTFLNWVKNNTPASSTILLPPQAFPWPEIGNSGLARYFLYPRKVVNGTIDGLSQDKYDYVLAVWGKEDGNSNNFGWPKITVKNVNVIMLDTKFSLGATANIFSTSLFDNGIMPWGLIKVNKNL